MVQCGGVGGPGRDITGNEERQIRGSNTTDGLEGQDMEFVLEGSEC